MSIFVRPASPPPRQPSPDIMPAPLPYPHHPRRVVSQPKIKVVSPSRPPGLSPTRTVQPARSYDHMRKTHNDDNRLSRSRTSSSLKTQQPSRGPELNPQHMSTLTVHVHPVANTPTTTASGSKRILRPYPNSFDSLYLPQIDEIVGANAIPQRKPSSKSVLPPLEKHKSLGMACFRFFRIRNFSRHPPAVFSKH